MGGLSNTEGKDVGKTGGALGGCVKVGCLRMVRGRQDGEKAEELSGGKRSGERRVTWAKQGRGTARDGTVREEDEGGKSNIRSDDRTLEVGR